MNLQEMITLTNSISEFIIKNHIKTFNNPSFHPEVFTVYVRFFDCFDCFDCWETIYTHEGITKKEELKKLLSYVVKIILFHREEDILEETIIVNEIFSNIEKYLKSTASDYVCFNKAIKGDE